MNKFVYGVKRKVFACRKAVFLLPMLMLPFGANAKLISGSNKVYDMVDDLNEQLLIYGDNITVNMNSKTIDAKGAAYGIVIGDNSHHITIQGYGWVKNCTFGVISVNANNVHINNVIFPNISYGVYFVNTSYGYIDGCQADGCYQAYVASNTSDHISLYNSKADNCTYGFLDCGSDVVDVSNTKIKKPGYEGLVFWESTNVHLYNANTNVEFGTAATGIVLDHIIGGYYNGFQSNNNCIGLRLKNNSTGNCFYGCYGRNNTNANRIDPLLSQNIYDFCSF